MVYILDDGLKIQAGSYITLVIDADVELQTSPFNQKQQQNYQANCRHNHYPVAYL